MKANITSLTTYIRSITTLPGNWSFLAKNAEVSKNKSCDLLKVAFSKSSSFSVYNNQV